MIHTNLHSHTQFCDGRSSMQELLEAPRAVGFKTWGFSPHGPIGFDSPCNMEEEDIAQYLEEIERLRKLYPDMEILAGMEVDYIDRTNGPAQIKERLHGLDYIIGSVHFIPNQKGEYIDIDGSPQRFARNLHERFNDDLNYVVRTFWQQSLDMIKCGGFDIIGHLDKIACNASSVRPDIEDSADYQDAVNATIRAAIDAGLAIEINTKHYKRFGRFFPHQRYWKTILDSGIDMPINSDTHHVEGILTGVEEARKILKEISKNDII